MIIHPNISGMNLVFMMAEIYARHTSVHFRFHSDLHYEYFLHGEGNATLK